MSGPAQSTQKAQDPRPGFPLGLAVIPLAVFALLVTVFYFGLYRGDPSRLPSALLGKPVPEFTLPALEGLVARGVPVPGIVSSDLAQGRVSIINVWASWCGPCRDEHPALMHLAQTQDVLMAGINYKDNPSNARRFLGQIGNPFAAVGRDTAGETSIDWGVYGVPETFIVDGSGTIVYKHVGPITAADLENIIVPAIEAARAAPQVSN